MDLREAVIAADLTAKRLAARAGLHENTVRQALTGKRMTPRTAYRIARALAQLGYQVTLKGSDRRS